MNLKARLAMLAAVFLMVLIAFSIWLYQRDNAVYLPFISDREQVWSSFIVNSLPAGPQISMDEYIKKNTFLHSALNKIRSEGKSLNQIELLYKKSLQQDAQPVFLLDVEDQRQISILYRTGLEENRKCWVMSLNKADGSFLIGTNGIGNGMVNFPFFAASVCNTKPGLRDDEVVPKISYFDFMWTKALRCLGACSLTNGIWAGSDMSDDRVHKMVDVITKSFNKNESGMGGGDAISIVPNYVYLGGEFCALNYTVQGGYADELVNTSSFRCGDDVSVLVEFSPQVFVEFFGE